MVKPSYGVIVGRFQVPELHSGHLELFRAVRGYHNRIIVFLGVSAGLPTHKNPLDFESRRLMIQAKFPEFTVLPLTDKRTDEEWSENLDSAILTVAPWGDVILYGSRDSFVPRYKGIYSPKELVLPIPPYSGTTIREEITNTVQDNRDFRAGVIYAVNNRRPAIYTTVDVAVMAENYLQVPHVLLASKAGFSGLRFIGGFAEPTMDFESDAKREVWEETSLDIQNVTYIGSHRIADWRYEGSPDTIKTLFFRAFSMTMAGTARDDINYLTWLPIRDIREEEIVPEHRALLKMLLRSLDEEKSNPRNRQL